MHQEVGRLKDVEKSVIWSDCDVRQFGESPMLGIMNALTMLVTEAFRKAVFI